MRDSKSLMKTLVAIKPAPLSGTTDQVGEIIDRKGYDSCTFVLITDAIAASSLAARLLIEEDDDAAMATAAAVADADLVGLEADTAVTQASDKVALKVGYKGTKRYVRATLDITTNNGTDVMGTVCILENPHLAPVS